MQSSVTNKPEAMNGTTEEFNPSQTGGSDNDDATQLHVIHDREWMMPTMFEDKLGENFRILRKMYAIGAFALYMGMYVVYADNIGAWLPITHKTAQSFIVRTIGISNASSGIGQAFSYFSQLIIRYCAMRPAVTPPLSVNFSSRRMEAFVDDQGDLRFVPCRPLLVDKDAYKGPREDVVNGLCYNPVLHDYIPTMFKFKGSGEVLGYISSLFTYSTDLVGLCWFVGNAILDPVDRPRMLMLSGPGGSGKSKVIEMVVNSLHGCCSHVPDDFLTSSKQRVEDEYVRILSSSRVVQNAEVDLETSKLNAHLVKVLTGGDTMSVDGINTKVVSSLIIGTNGVPSYDEPIYSSDAVLRRMVVMPMTVNALDLEPTQTPHGALAWTEFLCTCIYTRLKMSSFPMSGRTLVATLSMNKFSQLEPKLRFVDTYERVNMLDAIAAVGVIAGVLQITPDELIRRARLVSKNTVHTVDSCDVIAGVVISDQGIHGAPSQP